MSTEEEKKAKSLESLERIRASKTKTKEVTLEPCDLSKTKDVKIKEGAKVDLTKAKGKLPDPVEFDM